ncbi:MAG: ATP-dependent helicase [Succinivibrionaceae bacterium]
MQSLLNSLNEEQLGIVTRKCSNIMVVAGAGTGKTTLLIARIVYLLNHYKIPPRNIVALTFTNKATKEIRYRIEKYSNEFDIDDLTILTFHAFCLKILRFFYKEAKLDKNFIVIDANEQMLILKDVIKNLNLNFERDEFKNVLDLISFYKEKGIRPNNLEVNKNTSRIAHFNDIYSLYETECRKHNSVDFSEILLRTYEIIKEYPHVKDILSSRYREILIDEFQDTNALQYSIIKSFSGDLNNVLIVGDDDQSIYGWRGAQIENMFKFKNEFKDVFVGTLFKNYRSTKPILNIANKLINNNSKRLTNKILVSCNQNNSSKVTIVENSDPYSEAQYVASTIKNLSKSKGISLSNFAVLYRASNLSHYIENAFNENFVNYKIYGGLKFYEREEIKNYLSYIRLAINTNDDLAFNRIVNVPSRKIGSSTLNKLQLISHEENISLYDSLVLINKKKPNKRFDSFINIIESLRLMLGNKDSTMPLFLEQVWENSNLKNYYELKDLKNNKTELNRCDNVYELIDEITTVYENNKVKNIHNFLLQYMSDIQLLSSSDNLLESKDESVSIMTIHASKGLEYQIVFIIGMEEGIMPHYRSLQENGVTPEDIDEERRIAYVGITRAKNKLFLSHCKYRYAYDRSIILCKPSRFLKEIES